MALFGYKTAKEKNEERKKKLSDMVTTMQKPPSPGIRILVHQQRKAAGLPSGNKISTLWEKSQQLKKKKK